MVRLPMHISLTRPQWAICHQLGFAWPVWCLWLHGTPTNLFFPWNKTIFWKRMLYALGQIKPSWFQTASAIVCMLMYITNEHFLLSWVPLNFLEIFCYFVVLRAYIIPLNLKGSIMYDYQHNCCYFLQIMPCNGHLVYTCLCIAYVHIKRVYPL